MTTMKFCRTLVVLPVFCFIQVFGYPNGAPTSVCIHNFPKHKTQQQLTPSPYIINLSPASYSAGDVITVTITSQDGNLEFKGFQIRAQAVTGNTEALVGTFPKDQLPPGTKGAYWWPKNVNEAKTKEPNCVTHTDNRVQMSLPLKWRAPSPGIGDIRFTAGIVSNYSTFWVTRNTAVLKANEPYAPPTLPYQIEQTVSPPIQLYNECGRTKGCMLYPDGCHGNDCMFAVSYTTSGLSSGVDFEVTGISPGYLSLAFSDDISMGRDLTTTCVQKDDVYSVQNGYNPSLYNLRYQIEGVSKIQVSRSGDRLNCRFTRDADPSAIAISLDGKATKMDFPLDKEWYLHLAYGPVYELTDIPEKHHILPIISAKKVRFTSKEIVGARSLHPTLRAHGSLGVVSWIAMAGCAIIIARFYKDSLSKKVLDKPIWFQVHRALALLAVPISAIGIIIIFISLKAWTKYATIHAVFGLVAVGLGLAQIIGGFLRPDLGTTKREVFNWIHRSFGILGFICAAVSVLLGFQVELIGEPIRLQGTATVVAWLAFYVLWFIVLQFIRLIKDRNTDKVETVAKNGINIQEPPSKKPNNTWRIIHQVWLGIGVLVTLLLVILILYYINVA